MDQPIRPKAEKPRIRVFRDERGFTRYEVSHAGLVYLWPLTFGAAWKAATAIFEREAAQA